MSGVRKSFYIVLPIISILVGILLLEAGLALFYPIPFSLEKNMYFEPDPYTGYRQKPLGRGHYPTGIDAIANSRGHRDAEVDVPKPEGVFRILMIGDSFTVGANVEQEDAYPQQLERLLNDTSKARVEVVNSGVGGWSPFQYAEYLNHYGAEFEPDLVVVGVFVGNDILVDRFSVGQTRTAVLGRRIPRQAALNRLTTLRVLAYENSHIFRALMRIKPNDMNFERADCEDFSEIFLAIQRERVDVHLAQQADERARLVDGNVAQLVRMQSIASDMGAGFLVVVLPDENQINPALQAQIVPADKLDDYDFGMPQESLRAGLLLNDIASLDLLEVFRSEERCLFMNDTHWIPDGHLLAAEQIRDYLRVSGLAP